MVRLYYITNYLYIIKSISLLFILLFLSYYVNAQETFCNQNKITYGTFDQVGNGATNLPGWNFTASGEQGWKEDWYGSRRSLYIDRQGGPYVASAINLNLCNNIPKQIYFDHYFAYLGNAELVVSLAGKKLIKIEYRREGFLGTVGYAKCYFNSTTVEVTLDGIIQVDGFRMTDLNWKKIGIRVKDFSIGVNDNLSFSYRKDDANRKVYLNHIELYEAKPPKPKNPKQTKVTVCLGKTFDLNTLLPEIDSDKVASWHSSRNVSNSLVQNPTAVLPGTYYLFQKYDCEGSCYSDPAVKYVTVEERNDTEKPTFTEPADVSYCVNNIEEVNYVNTTNGDVNTPPDYYEFETGYTGLDITNVSDNCCNTNTIAWTISPDSNGEVISGTGQPSASLGGKKLWLDVATENPKSSYTEKNYTITYTVTDCNGNISDEKSTTITIKPRPKIDRVN